MAENLYLGVFEVAEHKYHICRTATGAHKERSSSANFEFHPLGFLRSLNANIWRGAGPTWPSTSTDGIA